MKLGKIEEIFENNEFKVGIVFGRELFGTLNLFEPSMTSFKSKIVNVEQFIELMNLCEFSLNQQWALLYRGSEDGFDADDFHFKCDGRL